MRLFWTILGGAAGLIALSHFLEFGLTDVADTVRHTLFQAVSILTTTGFATKDIGGSYFPALARQIFLMLMVIGGCVGSTGGGIKVLRIGVLFKSVWRQVRRVIYGRASVNPITVDGDPVDVEEVRRVAGLFFAWVALLAAGGMITAVLSDHSPLAAASGMFSALGNIGPCYISVKDMTQLHPVIKVVYIIGMLAGRLEILPIVLIFTPQAWR
jgi:trk system potassium uptake protein TrkH